MVGDYHPLHLSILSANEYVQHQPATSAMKIFHEKYNYNASTLSSHAFEYN